MEKYIPKAAVVAEIERRIESCAKQREDMLNVQCHALADDASARMGELNYIKDIINNLEVKEVDLELNSFDATVCKIGSTYLKEMNRDAIANALEPYKNGDKVKVIVINKD